MILQGKRREHEAPQGRDHGAGHDGCSTRGSAGRDRARRTGGDRIADRVGGTRRRQHQRHRGRARGDRRGDAHCAADPRRPRSDGHLDAAVGADGRVHDPAARRRRRRPHTGRADPDRSRGLPGPARCRGEEGRRQAADQGAALRHHVAGAEQGLARQHPALHVDRRPRRVHRAGWIGAGVGAFIGAYIGYGETNPKAWPSVVAWFNTP